MSSGNDAREDRRRLRAERDVRAAHAMAHRIVDRAGTRAWSDPGKEGGRTVAEASVHLALTAERVLDALRVVAASGALESSKSRTFSQRIALRVLFLTWRFPEGLRDLPGTDPGGLNPDAGAVRIRHTAWAAEWIAFLRERPAAYFVNVRSGHPFFGELDVFEWARYLAVYARHLELTLPAQHG